MSPSIAEIDPAEACKHWVLRDKDLAEGYTTRLEKKCLWVKQRDFELDTKLDTNLSVGVTGLIFGKADKGRGRKKSNINLSALECLLRARKRAEHFLYNPAFVMCWNVLDFSGVGMAVVPEVPQELTPGPVQFSLQESVFLHSQDSLRERDSSCTWGSNMTRDSFYSLKSDTTQ